MTHSVSNEEALLSTSDAAAYLGISSSKLRVLANQGAIPITRLANNYRQFKVADLITYQQAQQHTKKKVRARIQKSAAWPIAVIAILLLAGVVTAGGIISEGLRSFHRSQPRSFPVSYFPPTTSDSQSHQLLPPIASELPSLSPEKSPSDISRDLFASSPPTPTPLYASDTKTLYQSPQVLGVTTTTVPSLKTTLTYPSQYIVDLYTDGTYFKIQDHGHDVFRVDYDKNVTLLPGSTLHILGSLKDGQGSRGETGDVLTAQGSAPPVWQGQHTLTAGSLSCTDCLNEAEIEDIYLLNTSDTFTGTLTIEAGEHQTEPLLHVLSTSGGTLFSVDTQGRTRLNDILYRWPAAETANGLLQTDGSGALSWTSVGAASIAPDSLDFTEFKDALTLDGNLSIASSASNYSVNVDSNTLFIDTANNRVGVGTGVPGFTLDVAATTATARIGQAELGAWPAVTTYTYFGHEGLDHSQQGNYALLQDSSGGTYINAASGQGIRFSIANTQIGTLDSSSRLRLTSTSGNRRISLFEAMDDDNQYYGFGINTNALRYQVGATAADHVFYAGTSATTSTELFRVKGTGNVGIGTDTSPDASLEIVNDGSGDSFLVADTNDGDASPFVIQSDGDVGIGTTSPANPLDIATTSSDLTFNAARITNSNTSGGGNGLLFRNYVSGAVAVANIGRIVTVSDGSAYGNQRLTLQSINASGLLTDVLTLKNGQVGINSTTPGAQLEIRGTNTTELVALRLLNLGTTADELTSIEFYDPTWLSTKSVIKSRLLAGATGTELQFFTASSSTATQRMVIDTLGNLGLGTTTFGTSAAKVLAIGNGTAPSTSPADSIQLWAEDVAASSELRVRDEAGNTTTLSPHNFSLFQPSEDYLLPWSYYSKNEDKGKEINVDSYGIAQAVEVLSGKQFIYARDLTTGETLRATPEGTESLVERVEALEEALQTLDHSSTRSARSEQAPTLSLDKEREQEFPLLDEGGVSAEAAAAKEDGVVLEELARLTITGALRVEGDATFLGDVDIKGNTKIAGSLTRGNEEAGWAGIRRGGREVTVTFASSHSFTKAPNVQVTPRDHAVTLAVTDVSSAGFTIRLAAAAPADMIFNWTALEVSSSEIIWGEGDSVESDRKEIPKESNDEPNNDQSNDSATTKDNNLVPTPSPVTRKSKALKNTTLSDDQVKEGAVEPASEPQVTP